MMPMKWWLRHQLEVSQLVKQKETSCGLKNQQQIFQVQVTTLSRSQLSDKQMVDQPWEPELRRKSAPIQDQDNMIKNWSRMELQSVLVKLRGKIYGQSKTKAVSLAQEITQTWTLLAWQWKADTWARSNRLRSRWCQDLLTMTTMVRSFKPPCKEPSSVNHRGRISGKSRQTRIYQAQATMLSQNLLSAKPLMPLLWERGLKKRST